MSKNVELKVRYEDLDRARELARAAGAEPAGILRQTDTFYAAPKGRLKLRRTPERSELIAYDRSDRSEARTSDYALFPTSDPETLDGLLARSLGTSGIVRKKRELWLWNNVRIHLDDVENLGAFVELEAIVDGDTDENAAHAKVEHLIAALCIDRGAIEREAYVDLLAAKGE